MKLRITALAALLLCFAIACEQKSKSPIQGLEELKRTTDSEAPQPATTEDKDEVTVYNTEDYDNIVENEFLAAIKNPLSTFSIDVDEAAYSNVRRCLEGGSIPPAGAVRIEEMVNYFDYEYPQPSNDE